MKENDIIDKLDALVSLPRRDVLSKLIASKTPISALEIAQSLTISMSEALDHLQVLQRVGLVDMEKKGPRTVWFFSNPLELQVYISKEGIRFKQSKPSLWKRLNKSFQYFFQKYLRFIRLIKGLAKQH